MKFLVFFVALAMFVCAQALTDEQKEKVKLHYRACVGETGVDMELVMKTRAGDFSIEDDKLDSFFLCMFKKVGVMTDDGKFLKDVAVSKVEDAVKDKVAAAIDACVDKVGETPQRTAFNYAKCYHTVRPDHDFI